MTTIPSWIEDGSPIADPFGYGERAVQWLRRHLRHPKNPARGNPFQLDGWQERIIRAIYGPRHLIDDIDNGIREGDRIVRRVHLWLPRGNRKTSLAAAITLLHLIGPERIPGDALLSAASAQEQSRILFDEIRLIHDFTPPLRKHLRIKDHRSTISFRGSGIEYKAISADAKTQHGKTPRLVVADELHVWKGNAGKELWAALDNALIKVANTLMVVASTSGRGQDNLAWSSFEYALKVQEGKIHDPATLPVIFMAGKEDDWKDESVWRKVNPGMRYGYPDLAGFRDKARKAQNSPSDVDDFRQFNLNVWLDKSTSGFVDMDTYDAGANPVDYEALKGERCWLGVDLSSSGDLTVVVAAWKDGNGFIVRPWFFCPADNLADREAKSGMPYRRWAEEGLIEATPGNVVDFRAVEARIRQLHADHDVREIAFDPALARNILNNLLDDGLPAVEMRQGALTMMPAIAELERAVLAKRFRHGGHPILRWNFANAEVETNSYGHKVRLHKGTRHNSIDGAVAAAMAVQRAAVGDSNRSIYDNPNITVEDLVW